MVGFLHSGFNFCLSFLMLYIEFILRRITNWRCWWKSNFDCWNSSLVKRYPISYKCDYFFPMNTAFTSWTFLAVHKCLVDICHQFISEGFFSNFKTKYVVKYPRYKLGKRLASDRNDVAIWSVNLTSEFGFWPLWMTFDRKSVYEFRYSSYVTSYIMSRYRFQQYLRVGWRVWFVGILNRQLLQHSFCKLDQRLGSVIGCGCNVAFSVVSYFW